MTEDHKKLSILLSELNFSPDGPGQNGDGVTIEKEKEKMKEMFKINQFNLMASDQISINRSLLDYRSSK